MTDVLPIVEYIIRVSACISPVMILVASNFTNKNLKMVITLMGLFIQTFGLFYPYKTYPSGKYKRERV